MTFSDQITGKYEVVAKEWKKGDKVYVRSHGLATVTRPGNEQLAVTVDRTGASLLLTMSHQDAMIRPVMTKAEALRLLMSMGGPVKHLHTTWNRLFRELNDKIRNGEPQELAEVATRLAQKDGDFSFGERKMFDAVMDRLSDEIGYATGKDSDSVRKQIEEKLSKKAS